VGGLARLLHPIRTETGPLPLADLMPAAGGTRSEDGLGSVVRQFQARWPFVSCDLRILANGRS
jgi:hypothetical protein